MGKKNRRERQETTQPSSACPGAAAAAAASSGQNGASASTTATVPLPQLRFTLSDARKSNVIPRDVSTLVSQVLLPFDHPNYLVVESSQQWFLLQHARAAPACVVIGIPGLPLEALVATDYLQPEKVDPQQQQQQQQPSSSVVDDVPPTASTTKTGEVASFAGNAATATATAADGKKDDNNDEADDDDDAQVFKGAFPPNFNPWLRHVRALPNVSCCKLWLPSTFSDANLANDFFFRNKPAEKAAAASTPNAGNNSNNNKSRGAAPAGFASALALLKRQKEEEDKSAAENNKNGSAAAAAAAAGGTDGKSNNSNNNNNDNDDDDDIDPQSSAATLDMSVMLGICDKAVAQLWDPIRNPLMLELALDADTLKILDFPYETDSGEGNYPVSREYGTMNAGSGVGAGATQILNFDCGDGESANVNCAAAKAVQDDDDDEVENDTDDAAAASVAAQSKKNNIEQQQQQQSTSSLKPLPPYRRLWQSCKQTVALECLKLFLSDPSKNSSDIPLTSEAGELLGEKLIADIKALASQLLHDVELTNSDNNNNNNNSDKDGERRRRDRIPVVLSPSFFSSSSSLSSSSSRSGAGVASATTGPTVSSVDSDGAALPNFSALALDCEMVQTEMWGSTLARLTIVECPSMSNIAPVKKTTIVENSDGVANDDRRINSGSKNKCPVLLDVLVRPDNAVTDYVTRFSGISKHDLDGVQLTLESVQLLMQCVASRDGTFVVGHSLENDFIVMRLLAEPHRVLDSGGSLYPSPRGLPYRNSLKYLANNYLNGRNVQNSANGHDSAEDARTAMDLVTLKLKKGAGFGMPNRVNVLTWWNGSCSLKGTACTTATSATSTSSNSNNRSTNNSGNGNGNHHGLILPAAASSRTRVYAHVIDRRSVLQKVSVNDTNAIYSSNDGTTSHRAQKLLQKLGSSGDGVQQLQQQHQQQQQDDNDEKATSAVVIKNFLWTQLYDAALSDEEQQKQHQQQQQQQQQQPAQTKEGERAADDGTARGEAVVAVDAEKKTQQDGSGQADEEEMDLGKMLKEHVVSVHRRLHRIVNAAPAGSVILIMACAHHNNTVTIQQAHPAAHGMLFGFVKPAATGAAAPLLPEGDDMFDTTK